MQCDCKKEYVNEYLDINGVKYVFKVIKDNLDKSKNDLLKQIKKNEEKLNKKLSEKFGRIDEKIHNVDCDIHDIRHILKKIGKGLKDMNDGFNASLENYYTKTEVDDLIENIEVSCDTDSISDDDIRNKTDEVFKQNN